MKPFWQAGASDPARPRLLLISYHFPPGQATGALRWQKFAGFAYQRGFELDVVTLSPHFLRQVDERRFLDLPPGTRIFGSARTQPRLERAAAGLLRFRRSLRTAAVSAPTARQQSNGGSQVGLVFQDELRGWSLHPRAVLLALRAWRSFAADDLWARDAQRVAGAIVEPGLHCAVISCGPPHAAHDAARRVARAARLPYVMDMRDPWSLVPAVESFRASPLFYRIVGGREKAAMRQAALVVVNTPVHERLLADRYPAAAERIISVLNGCDEEPVPPLMSDRFTIAFAGNIYIDRDPRPIFRAAARLVRERGLTPRQFAIEFLGNVDAFAGRSVLELAAENGIEGFVHVHPSRPREEALQFLARAPMLLSLPQGVDLSIPSKIYEYMQFQAWVLALADAGSATELVLRGTCADVVAPDDEDAIAAVLAGRFAEYDAGVRPPRLIDRNPELKRGRQAAKFFDALQHRLRLDTTPQEACLAAS